MIKSQRRSAWLSMVLPFLAGVFLFILFGQGIGNAQKTSDTIATVFTDDVKPLLGKYCLSCHNTKSKKGGLDLQRFANIGHVRKDLKPWQQLIEQIEASEMPPKSNLQPTAEERKRLLDWTRRLLETEARARAGDPGFIPLRRLSNAEYDATIRDLTGVDLRPAREFPADGAAGEGFTNAAEALTDISPTLLNKYLNAAKDIADHAVLLPDGFRFSPSKTRRDWTDENTARLRRFYSALVPGDGKLPFQTYLAATVRHRESLSSRQLSVADVAATEKLNPKYLSALWAALNDTAPSQPLDTIRTRWRNATLKDVPALAADVTAWQAILWKTVRVGNYIQASWNASGGYQESLSRQIPNDPPAVNSVPLRLAVKPSPGESEVTLYLAAKEEARGVVDTPSSVIWYRPRFEASGKPTLLLRDFADFGPAYTVDYPVAFADSANYLAAAVELANAPSVSADDVAKSRGLNPEFLKNWVKLLAIDSRRKSDTPTRPVVTLTPLDEKIPKEATRPYLSGWRKKATDLPTVLANSSDKPLLIPGRVAARGVSMHPTPQEFVAITWTSPITGTIRVTARVAHAHPTCGNGVAWWLEHRHAGRATLLGEGALDLGKAVRIPAESIKMEKGDVLVLAVDARDGNHACDMTEVGLTLTDDGKPARVWDLGADVSGDILAGNPHADSTGTAAIWGFARGPSKKGGTPTSPIPPGSVLARWRSLAKEADRGAELDKLARDVQTLLSGPRPKKEGEPDRVLYDRLVAVEGPLFAGLDVTKLAKTGTKSEGWALPKDRFTGDGVLARVGEVVAVRLPAALLVGREFVVDAKLERPSNQLVRARVATTPPDSATRWDGPLIGSPTGPAYRQLIAGHDAFRKVFPLYLCFPAVVPTDEVVTLKMFHREDEPLIRLFLNEEQTRQLDRLWTDQRFISRQAVAENDYLPQFMGYTTQDTPKAFQQFFIDRKPLFEKHAREFEADETASVPKHLDALLEFAGRAFRRPLTDKEKTELRQLYRTVREKGTVHVEALRGVLTRVLVSPAFLFRIENAPPGANPARVNDWEFATRLSYFLWSSMPDEELRRLAFAGSLRDPKVLSAQVTRMLADERTRSLAIEFGTQWIHVRGFDELKEKSEKLFPMFDGQLRQAMYEEAILFFQHLFQADQPVTRLLDADYTFLNATLAKHYGIPGVNGPQYRRVDGVRKYGRGGLLGLGAVQTKQAGASRTSPVLRGNWVVETLLGEKLPRPPADVPQLPQEEGGGLTMRQQVERHAKDPACAVCHVRIDPFGFALENFDPIGRWRTKDLSGLAVDAKVKLRDDTAFEGIDGLRTYLLTKKKEIVLRLFCRRLLGYALGRSVTLSDETLIDEMVVELNKNEGRLSAAVQAIVRSKPFGTIRGSDYAE